VIVKQPDPTDDPLLWRVRRSVAQTRTLVPRAEDYRKALHLTAEIGAELAQLNERLARVEQEIRTASRRVTALSAYHRSAALGRGRS
jgi:hypothetical protein